MINTSAIYPKPIINKLFKKNEVTLINHNNQKIVDEKSLINIINMSNSNSNELFYNFKEEFAHKCFYEYEGKIDKNVFGKEPKLILFENCKLGSVASLPAQLRSANTAIIFSYDNEEEFKRNVISQEEFASTVANVSSRYIFDETSITSNSIINDNANYYTLSLKDTKYKLYTNANKKRISVEF